MKKLSLLKNKFANQRISVRQACQIKGGDDKRKERPIDPAPLPGGGGALPNSVISVTLGGGLIVGD